MTVAAGLPQPRVDLLQLIGILDLDAEMIETGLAAARRDRKIHARIVEHPFRVIRLDDRRLRGEQRRIEPDGVADLSTAT